MFPSNTDCSGLGDGSGYQIASLPLGTIFENLSSSLALGPTTILHTFPAVEFPVGSWKHERSEWARVSRRRASAGERQTANV